MKKIMLMHFFICLFACGCHNNQEKKEMTSSKDYLLQHNSVKGLVATNHQKLSGIICDLKSYKLYLDQLENDSITSIPFALDYIQTCLLTDNVDRDSIFFLFHKKFYAITSSLNDSLNTKYKFLVNQIEYDSSTVELKSFENNLAVCGIGIYSTDGTYYLDAIPDFLYNTFKNRVSEGLVEFLYIRKEELKQGFSQDAAMLISFEDLYQRVKRWENFLKNYPNTVYNSEAISYFETYLVTLMTGMDNSKIFDFQYNSLLPEINTLYENIIKDEPISATTEIISSYYTFLARHDFKENDSIQIFLKMNGL